MGLRLRAQSKANQRAHRVFGLTVELEVSALRNLWIWLATVVLATTVSWSASTIVGWDFEQGMGQWQSPDPLTKITLAVGPKEANSGSSALYVKFPRIQKPDEMQTRQMPGAVMMQLPAAPAPAPTCLEFAVRAKLLTPLMIILSRNDGVSYTRPVMVVPGPYRHVKLYLTEFLPDEKAKPPVRPIDGGQIQGIGFLDGSAFVTMFATAAAQNGPIRVPMPQQGDNELWFDDIKLTDETPPAQLPPMIDGAAEVAKFVAVMNVDGTFSREPAGLGGKPCWLMNYQLAEHEVAAIWGGVPIGMLPGTAGLHVMLSATAPTTLILQVKERSNAEYNTMLALQPGQTLDRVVPWSEFKLGDNQQDPDGKLDLDDIKEVALIDISAALPNGQPQANGLRLGIVEPAR
jgi:hypothetical protein